MTEYERKILLRIYWLGMIPIIITPTTLSTMADITIKLNENIRLIINIIIWIIGYYIIPSRTFWIMDFKPIINNQIDYKKLKKYKKRQQK